MWTAGKTVVTGAAPNVTIAEPALTVTKAASPVRGDAEDLVTFTLVLQHAATSTADAFGAVLSDTLPAGLVDIGTPTVTAGVPATSLMVTSGAVVGPWDQFPLGSISTVTFTGRLSDSVVPGTVLTNTAAAALTSLPEPTSALSPLNPLAAERTGNPLAIGGAANTYRATGTATVTVNTNSLAGRVYVDANGDGIYTTGEQPIGGVTIRLTGVSSWGRRVADDGHLADGTYAFLQLRPGAYELRETQPAAFADGLDTAGSAGGAVGNDVISAIPLPKGGQTLVVGYNFGETTTADLEIVKSDAPDPVLPGGTLTYTVTVRNLGPNDAMNAQWRDPLPAGTLFTSMTTAAGWTCTTPAAGTRGDIACSVPTLPNGAVATFTVVLQVSPAAVEGAVLTNAVAVRSDTVDQAPANNTDLEPTVVAGATSADLAIVKTDAADPVLTGANVTYTLTVTNNGPATATGVTVADTVPAGLVFVSAAPSQGTCTGTTCDLGSLTPGDRRR